MKPRKTAVPASQNLYGTNLSRAGEYNQRVTLQAVLTNGPITRVEIAELTGLSGQSIANIAARLFKQGLIKQDGRILGARGQPAIKMVVNPNGAFSVGLNIDRDHITLVTMNLTGQVIYRVVRESPFDLPENVLAFVKTHLDHIAAEGLIDISKLIGIGVGIPDDLGLVDLPNKPKGYEAWATTDIVSALSKQHGLPVFIENDATAAAIGELKFGHAPHMQNFVYTLISAGLGQGIIVEGNPYSGAQKRSGEIGFLPLDLAAGSPDRATLQDVVSLYALYAFLKASGIEVHNPDDLMQPDAKMATAIAQWSDKAVEHLLGPFMVTNGLLNPEVHYIGGRLPTAVIEQICDKLNARLEAYRGRIPHIARFVRAQAAVDAAPMGAAVLVFQNLLLPTPQSLRTQSSLKDA